MKMELPLEQGIIVVKFYDKLGISATARASIGVYNSKDDIDVLCQAIDNCKKVFKI